MFKKDKVWSATLGVSAPPIVWNVRSVAVATTEGSTCSAARSPDCIKWMRRRCCISTRLAALMRLANAPSRADILEREREGGERYVKCGVWLCKCRSSVVCQAFFTCVKNFICQYI